MKNGNLCKTVLLLAACFVIFLNGRAQEISVKGRLVDSASAKPVADATINFMQPQTKASRTVVSDKSGGFQANLLPGAYKVTVTHSSFRKKGLNLAVQDQPVDMGTIQLITFVKKLSEVSVISAKPLVEQKDDRLVYNVEEDPAAKSESASDLLRKTPYVNVDGDGAIQVNGQSNFKVLLNGRETALFSQNVKEALKGFPGATISRIEVITSPSAKYDAEGVGGIINIITKKKVAGYSGSINSNISTIGHRGVGFNINLKTGKLGISGMYNHMTNGGILSQQLAITTPFQPVAFVSRQVGGTKDNEMYFHQGNLELSYDIDSTNTLVLYGNIGKNNFEAVNQQTIQTSYSNGTSNISPYILDTKGATPTYGFGTDYIRKYKGKPQKEFTFRFNASYNKNRSFASSEQVIGASDRFVLNNSEAFNNEYTLQADFIEPLNKTTRIETGVKTILRNASSDFESQEKYNKADPYVINPSNTNKFNYNQNVYGGYVSVNKVTKIVTARIGLRVEHTQVDGDFTSTETTVRQRYTDLIPNVMLMKQFSKTMNSNLTYSIRIGRPSIQSLNPFVNNSDSLFINFGNPNLGRQYTHNVTLQNKFFKGNKFLSIQAQFNFSNNLIIQNPTFNSTTGVTAVTSANAGQMRDFGLGFVSNLPVGKWNLGLNATGRVARIRNKLQTPWTTATAGSVNANITYKASKLFTITSNNGYFTPMRMPNATFPDNYFYGLNFIFKVLKEKLTLNASTTNFFEKERKLKFLTENQSFQSETLNTIPFRNFGLSVAYNFGKLKENVSKKKGVNNDDQVQ